MAKREKIIVILMVIGVLYAGYTYMFDPAMQTKLPTLDRNKLQQEIQNVTSTLTAQSLSETEDYRITQALAQWNTNPFYKRALYESDDNQKRFTPNPEAAKLFSYKGYVDIGVEKLAVINGLEYKIDEELETPNYYLTGIFKDKAIIEERNATQDVINRVTVPLEENFVNLFGEDNATESNSTQ